MALSFLYLMTRRLVGMLLGSLRIEHAKNIEIAVLRHQLDVLHRQVRGPEFRPADRALLAMLSSWRRTTERLSRRPLGVVTIASSDCFSAAAT
jgi:hypothetical protein